MALESLIKYKIEVALVLEFQLKSRWFSTIYRGQSLWEIFVYLCVCMCIFGLSLYQ